MNGSKKSSRSKADYFEILIANELAQHYNLKKNFTEELKELRKSVLDFENGEYRVEEQERKAQKTSEQLINFLTKEGVVKIKDLEWVGRYHQTEHTLSDVDVINENNQIIGISLKSVRTGTGTQKNLGFDTVKQYLSIDIESDLNEMWKNVRQELIKNGLREIAELPQTKIKDKKYKYPIIREIGKKFGLPIQNKAVEQSVKNFNTLSPEKKASFLKCVYGIEENKTLLNVLAQESKVEIYWNDKFEMITSGENLIAKKIRDRSYRIEYNNIPILRVQTSFTNGIGISAFCQRAFLIDW